MGCQTKDDAECKRRVRTDFKCGVGNNAADGKPAACNPKWPLHEGSSNAPMLAPCCSVSGWCGNSESHCGGVDYRKVGLDGKGPPKPPGPPRPDGTMDIAGQLMLTFEWSDWRNGMFLWIQSVYVAAHHRRKGVFRALYAHVTEMAASPSYCGVRLYVHEDNPSAQETYLKLGMLDAGYTILETPESFLPTNEPDPAPSLSRT